MKRRTFLTAMGLSSFAALFSSGRTMALVKGGHAKSGNAVHTGFRDLDAQILGLRQSELMVLAGQASVGKTNLALNIVSNVAMKRGLPVALFSMYDTKSAILNRLMASLSDVGLHNIRTGSLTTDEQLRLLTAQRQLDSAPIYIDSTPQNTPAKLLQHAKRIVEQHSRGLGLIVVDSLQLMQTEQNLNRDERTVKVIRELKSIAREFEVPMIVLSHINMSKVDQRPDPRPLLSDLCSLQTINQNADVICMMYRDEIHHVNSQYKNQVEIFIRKNPRGVPGKIQLSFNGNSVKLSDIK